MSAFLDLLLESSVRALAVALLVGSVLLVSRSRVSSVRHAAWTFALGAMLLMPVLVRISPVLPVVVPAPDGLDAVGQVMASAMTPAAIEPSVAFEAPVVVTPTAVPPPARPFTAVEVLLVIWAAGAFGLLARLTAGFWLMRRIWRRAESIDAGVTGGRAYASGTVSVPMTVGFFRPRVILPVDWPAWPAQRLAAVLAHETAHVRRRDSLILLLAALNQCVFWFHPLAWWLTRTLAATAEEACDAAAVRAVGNARQYAQILLAIANEARRGRGRVAWAAVGIHGAGRFNQRIDRILGGDGSPVASRKRSAGVLTACAVGLLLVVSCRQQVAKTIELKEDPDVAARLTGQKAFAAFHDAATKMTAEEVAALERKLEADAEDLDARRKLILFYQRQSGRGGDQSTAVAGAQRHIHWMIERHPEDDISVRYATPWLGDPTGDVVARTLWLAQANKPGVTSAVLSNAAQLFETVDPATAEQLLLRAKAIDPDGPTPRIDRNNMYHLPWSRRLGMLYARAIVGARGRSIAQMDPALANGLFAQHARKALQETTDARMLTDAGWALVRVFHDGSKLTFDPRTLGRSYLERASRLQPGGEATRQLASLDRDEQSMTDRKAWLMRQAEAAGGDLAQHARAADPQGTARFLRLADGDYTALDAREAQFVASLSETERFARLPQLAEASYNSAEAVDYYQHDAGRSKMRWERSKAYARDLLALAPNYQSDPQYANAIYSANVVLSINALREGDVKASVGYLNEAVKAPSLPAGREFGLENKLVNYLLKNGERESVAEFLEKSAAINPAQRDRFLRDAANIRAGVMPESYQYMVTPR